MISRFGKRSVVITAIFIFVVFSVFYTSKSNNQVAVAYDATNIGGIDKLEQKVHKGDTSVTKTETNNDDYSHLNIKPFMPKMENATLKQELGRSTWKLLHNILARYPENPTTKEKESLKQFFQSFVTVYPCGDCANHFSKLLEKYPPQVQNKQTAAVWGCHIHNKVNERLDKPIYDCTDILNDYDCGCGGEEDDESFKELSDPKSTKETVEHLESIKIESSEGYQRGG